MIFDQPEIIKILQEEFHWSDADIEAMQSMYASTIHRLVIDESMLYIEQHNLPENKELAELLQQLKGRRGELATEISLIRFIAKLPEKYPKLAELIREKVRIIDEELSTDLIDSLSEEAAVEILKIINSDLDKIQNIEDKYLKVNPLEKASSPS